MYVVSEMKDTVSVQPNQFKNDFIKAITSTLDNKLANKVKLYY